MKKIMQINITCGKGSTGRLSLALYNATLHAGYDAKFAYSAYTPSLETAFNIETKLQNYLRRGLNKYLGRRIRHSRPGTKRLIRYIEQEKPDLIHLHNVQQNSIDYPLFFEYLKKTQIPIVYTLHDCWAFTGGCYHFTAKNCSQYQTGCKNCFPLSDRDDMSINPMDAYAIKANWIGGNDNIYPVTVSNWLCECATSSYMGKMKHLPRLIYNGIDTNVFYPRDRKTIRNKLDIEYGQVMVLGVASFWEDGKGMKLFLKLRECLGEAVKIVLIGSDSDKVKQKNADIIAVPQIESADELAEYYSAADIFVNASIEETFGLTTAEALACGTPAIVFNSTACPEVVDQKTGIVVEKFAAESVAEAIRTICLNNKEKYSDNCVNRVKQLFSEVNMVGEYIKLYQLLLGDKVGRE